MAFRWRTLTSDEVAELAARVAELTKAGLPLGAGLRALAGEVSGFRLRHVLRRLADRLDAGDDLVSALDSQGRALPTHLRGLVLAGVRSGRLPDVLEEYVDLERSQSELRHRVWLSLGYPFVLLVFMTALAVGAARITVLFDNIFRDFNVALPTMTLLAINGSMPLAWFLAGLVCLMIMLAVVPWSVSGMRWIWPVLHRAPMVGPLLRWGHLRQFSRLMGILLEQNVPLPDALRFSAAGVRDGSLAWGARRAAEDVEKGRPLDESLAARRQFPASLIPIVQWGQRTPALADAFRAAAEMFEGRVYSTGTLLEALMLPVMLLIIVVFVGFFVVAMFLPLISLITNLSQ